ncbi:MAG TPA: hypothetical protein VMH82_01530 [Myxococcota bacterium]|nr:hypothetical protein [Myxococcota bacterium]
MSLPAIALPASPLGWIGAAAAALVAIAWLVVSFLGEGRPRQVAARIGTNALYLALLCFFLNLLLRAHAEGRMAGVVGFGVLVALFGIGLPVSLAKTIGALRGRAASGDSATN